MPTESDNVVRIARRYFDLTGCGTEYVIDSDNNVLAKFFNGKLVSELPRGNKEATLAA